MVLMRSSEKGRKPAQLQFSMELPERQGLRSQSFGSALLRVDQTSYFHQDPERVDTLLLCAQVNLDGMNALL
jgi:hypothetical protein